MIDYQALHGIFGDTLPEAHTFFATRSNKYAPSYASLRKELGMTRARTNRAVWLRFVEKYKEETAVTDIPVSSVAITPSTASVAKGATQKFSAAVLPNNATNKNVTYSVDNASGTVDATGLLTVKADATDATIKVTATSVADGTKTSVATVTITTPQGA